jgi:glycosyltransferase involved in cell wall biosynthesis
MGFLLLMPSYNQARYIADAVRSALEQDDPDWELWIVDNSTDRTPEVMRAFDDPRIRFHHIPERMDPGSCLNWMLARAKGEHFSYVHTDNNLHPSYVRRFRRALSGHELGLAYCDMRVIDQSGKPKRMFRRGAFDLARLLSLDPLGVPFAATTELARRIDGFSVDDVADDVRFCCSAYGFAEYIHVPDPLLDYRLHDDSRTEHTGGASGMQAGFLDMFRKLRPTLERRGLQPLEVLAEAIEEQFDEIDWYLEHRWYRDVGRSIEPWWSGRPRAESFFSAGLLDLPGFSKQEGRPPIAARSLTSGRRIGRLDLLRVRRRLRLHRRGFKRRLGSVRNALLPWAVMSLGSATGTPQRFRVTSLDFRTVWGARELERSLGWTPLRDATLEAPAWLRWRVAEGTDPALDLRARPHLAAATP